MIVGPAPLRRGRPALLLGLAALAAWAAWIEPRRLVVRHVEVGLPGWPPEHDGLRVGLLSDLHAGMAHAGPPAIERAVRALNREAPDLVCLLGDFLDRKAPVSRAVDARTVARCLAPLRARLGVFAVLGNHDWFAGGRRIAVALEEAGIPVFEDEARELSPHLWLAGVSDDRTRGADVEQALREVGEDAAVILLSHDPDVFPRVPPSVALTLSGHTHGGQVDIPGLPLRLPSRYGQRYASGHVAEGGRQLYVTSGTGTSGLPLRFRRPPEVVILRLMRAS